MNYAGLIQFLGDHFIFPITDASSATPSSDTDINTALPQILDTAEQRIYTDMDLLQMRSQDYSKNCTANSRDLALPTGTMVVEGVSIITQITGHAAPSKPSEGKRNDCESTSLDFIDMCYSSESVGTGIPTLWAMRDAQNIVLAPTPSSAYMVEITGTKRPAAISATNTTTYVSTTYPQLLQAACAVSFCAYQKQFGTLSPDPQSALGWETLYQKFIATALMEEKRRRGVSITTSPSAPKPPAQAEDE